MTTVHLHKLFCKHADLQSLTCAQLFWGIPLSRSYCTSAAKYVEGQITSLIVLDPDWAGVHGTLADIQNLLHHSHRGVQVCKEVLSWYTPMTFKQSRQSTKQKCVSILQA